MISSRFEPVVLLPSNPMIVSARTRFGKSLQELLAWLKGGRLRRPPHRRRRFGKSHRRLYLKTSPASSCNTCRIAARRRR